MWTQGFFSIRFERAVSDLDAVAEQVTNGGHVANGTRVGGFEVHYIVVGHIGGNDTCDVGKEGGSPVSQDYGAKGNDFTGEVKWVQIDLEKDDHDHLITPEERFHIAMARQ